MEFIDRRAFLAAGIVARRRLAAALAAWTPRRSASSPYVTPISSLNRPNYWALYLFLAVVTASASRWRARDCGAGLAITGSVFSRVVDLSGHRDTASIG